MAVKIFTDRVEGEKSEQLKPASLLEFLKPYPDATLLYLEHLVNDGNSKVERDKGQKKVSLLERCHD